MSTSRPGFREAGPEDQSKNKTWRMAPMFPIFQNEGVRLAKALKQTLLSAGSGAVLLACAAPALAQTGTGQASTGTVGEVVVTASRITTAGFTAPTPTTVIGVDAIQKAGQ